MKKGVLLINLGTPKEPTPRSVGRYLREFLMDPYVIDIAYLWRWILVKVLIVPRRKLTSAKAYEKIWTSKGSPLLIRSQELADQLQNELGSQTVVVLAMRYGEPSVEQGLRRLKDAGVDHVTILPLYPQYALSSTESSLQKVKSELKRLSWQPTVRIIKDFFDRDGFVRPLATQVKKYFDSRERGILIFSFHGLPVRHIQTVADGDCYRKENCCDQISAGNRWCYRAQSYATARAVAKQLDLSEDRYLVTFQSRLGRAEWIKPYTDQEIPKLKGKIAIVCPSFVVDCLETLEEINIRAREDFAKSGGTDFTYIPCLNSNRDWIQGLKEILNS